MTFHECLFMYTMENVLQRFDSLYSAQMRDAKNNMEDALEKLCQLGPEAKQYAVELRNSMIDQGVILQETGILAGIAVGLELGEFV